MNKIFLEQKLPNDFCAVQIEKIKHLIEQSTSFTLSGMPGVGGSIFLRFLATRNFAHFVYVDTYELAEVSKLNYYNLLVFSLGDEKRYKTESEAILYCRKRLLELTQKNNRVVLILNRFDQLKHLFDNALFTDLLNLLNIDRERIVCIVTANKPYLDLIPPTVSPDKINVFAKQIFLTPFEETDMNALLKITQSLNYHSPQFISQAITLSGGHFQLLLKSERITPPFIDQFVRFQLKEIYQFLSYQQKKIVQKIAFDKKNSTDDPYLIGLGLVQKNNNEEILFSPLFTEFVLENAKSKLSLKESRLFKLFKENLNKVISTEQIFEEVWKENPEEASDWGLSSLLYRLRKHPTLKSQHLIIESYKKQGYKMFKE